MNNNIPSKSVRHHGGGRFFTIALLTLLIVGCRHDTPIQLYGQAQGTYYSVQYHDAQHRNLQPQVDSLLTAFDQSASLWVDSSLLRRINTGTTDSLDSTLSKLFAYSAYIKEYTSGAFNCCIGKLVQAWGFSFKERNEPDSTELVQLLKGVHSDYCINNNHLTKCPETEFDFNAIAQGYAADLVGQMLEKYGITDYLIDIGGEVVAHGHKSVDIPWRVGIEKPAATDTSTPIVQTAIELCDASVVTSGNYRKYYERNGVRYSHTIDPVTGRPVRHSLLSVSVVEREGWLADAMATAYMVMGLDSALAFIASHPDGPGTDAVFFIYDDRGELKTCATPEFEKLIIQ